MNDKWQEFIDNIKDDSAKLIKEELNNLLNAAKGDSEEFIRQQGDKLKSYLNQLASGKITKEQFEGYVIDIKDLTEMQMLKMTVAGKASAQRLANGISKIVIDGLLKII